MSILEKNEGKKLFDIKSIQSPLAVYKMAKEGLFVSSKNNNNHNQNIFSTPHPALASFNGNKKSIPYLKPLASQPEQSSNKLDLGSAEPAIRQQVSMPQLKIDGSQNKQRKDINITKGTQAGLNSKRPGSSTAICGSRKQHIEIDTFFVPKDIHKNTNLTASEKDQLILNGVTKPERLVKTAGTPSIRIKQYFPQKGDTCFNYQQAKEKVKFQKERGVSSGKESKQTQKQLMNDGSQQQSRQDIRNVEQNEDDQVTKQAVNESEQISDRKVNIDNINLTLMDNYKLVEDNNNNNNKNNSETENHQLEKKTTKQQTPQNANQPNPLEKAMIFDKQQAHISEGNGIHFLKHKLAINQNGQSSEDGQPGNIFQIAMANSSPKKRQSLNNPPESPFRGKINLLEEDKFPPPRTSIKCAAEDVDSKINQQINLITKKISNNNNQKQLIYKNTQQQSSLMTFKIESFVDFQQFIKAKHQVEEDASPVSPQENQNLNGAQKQIQVSFQATQTFEDKSKNDLVLPHNVTVDQSSNQKQSCPEYEKSSEMPTPPVHALVTQDDNTNTTNNNNNTNKVPGIGSNTQLEGNEYTDILMGELLGEGAYGKVYKGFIKAKGRFIAVKEIKEDQIHGENSSDFMEDFCREIQLLKKLQHKNIVSYLGQKKQEGTIQIYMEYMSGGSISQLLKRYGPFEEKVIQKFVKQLLEGLIYLHSQGVIHSDLKGANLLSDGQGNVKLADFGAAKRIDNILQYSLSQSEFCNSVKGSLYWMAPELIKNKKYGRRIDVWSLGCTMIEMATATHPWENIKKFSELAQVLLNESPIPIPETLSNECRDFIQQCCSYDKKMRPTSSELLKHPFISKTNFNVI